RRHRKSRQVDDRAALGRSAATGADAGHGRRVDLRARSGRDEPGQAGAEAFPRGSDVSHPHRLVVPAKTATGSGRRWLLVSLGPRLRGGDGVREVQWPNPSAFFSTGPKSRPSPPNPSGRSPTGKARKSRICAGCRSPAIAPTVIAALAWSRSRA